jgi:hypothetical protein
VVTSMSEAQYMALTLATKQSIWFTNARYEINVPVPNDAMFCDNKAAINIAYNHKIDHRSKHIDVTCHLVHENVESSRISHLLVELGESLADIFA